MQLKDSYAFFIIAGVAAAGGFIHAQLLRLFGFYDGSGDFYHPLQSTYLFFGICSVVIYTILFFVRKASIDQVGMTFLLITCIKMGIAYAYLHPALESGISQLEKVNFFIVFAVFLTLETVLTIGLLRKP